MAEKEGIPAHITENIFWSIINGSMAVNKKIGWCKNTDWYELQLQLLRFTMYGLEGLGRLESGPAWGNRFPGMMPFSFGKRTTARRFDVSSVLFLFGGLCGLQSADDVLIL